VILTAKQLGEGDATSGAVRVRHRKGPELMLMRQREPAMMQFSYVCGD
jgi:hypothetical protein